MGSVMLVAAVVASLGFGVAVAYGVCLGMFELFRVHQQMMSAARKPRVVVAANVFAGQ